MADRSRPVGWSSLCRSRRRCLTSPVAAAGTTPPAPGPSVQLVRRTHLAVCTSNVDLQGLDRLAPYPCGCRRATIGTPSVVSRPARVAPRRRAGFATLTESSPRCAHRSHPEAASPASVSTPWGAPRGQRRIADLLCGSPSDPDARCVGPTSAFSLLRTSTRASVVPGQDSRACASCSARGSPECHVRAIRFGGPHQGHLSTAMGVVVPSWRVRSSLWHPCRVSRHDAVARAKEPCRELPRPRPRSPA